MNFVVKKFSDLSLAELYEVLRVRSQVFIVEKNMNCQDIDGVDHRALHFYIEDNGKIVAYLRAFYYNDNNDIIKIGRVLSVTHGIGLGKDIMLKTIDYIKHNLKPKMIILDSQKSAIGFYEKFGFEVDSDEFLEEGVIHVKMELKI